MLMAEAGGKGAGLRGDAAGNQGEGSKPLTDKAELRRFAKRLAYRAVVPMKARTSLSSCHHYQAVILAKAT